MVLTNVAISLREMSLVRCTLCYQSRPLISDNMEEVVLRIAS
jgi:hypothetical protein